MNTAEVIDEQLNLTEETLPIAKVRGQPLLELPKDLYIPPDALEVILEAFEGPLDLLLYLIRRQNLDILDIPIAEITRQYMGYIEIMRHVRLELAGEYLVMAAILAEIKSRMLLPKPPEAEAEELDPRAELIKRLQEYERFKKAAEDLNALPILGRDVFPVTAEVPEVPLTKLQPKVEFRELIFAYLEAMQRAQLTQHHQISRETLSVRERMSAILATIKNDNFTTFAHLFKPVEGRMGVVVTLLAILELVKETLIELVQAEPFSPLYVKALA